MPHEWFKMVEEDEDKEEVLFSYNVIIVSTDFQERSVLVRQYKWTSGFLFIYNNRNKLFFISSWLLKPTLKV